MKKPVKICKNPDCGVEIVDYKSSKREYCSDYCRNHHGYINRTAYNLEFVTRSKGMAKNYELLKLHRDSNIYIEKLSKYEKFGFNTNYLPEFSMYNISGVPTKIYKMKDIFFSLDKSDNIIIHKEQKK